MRMNLIPLRAPCRPPPPHPSETRAWPGAGFTLAELLVVLLVIAVLGGIAVPRVNISKLRARTAVQALGTTLLALQREAMAKQYNVVVMIDAATTSLRVLYDSTGDMAISPGERVRRIKLGDGVAFGRPAGVAPRGFGGRAVNFATTEPTTGLPAIVFLRNGSAREFGGLYLTSVRASRGAAAEAGETWALEMIRATGRPEWYNWNGSGWKRGF